MTIHSKTLDFHNKPNSSKSHSVFWSLFFKKKKSTPKSVCLSSKVDRCEGKKRGSTGRIGSCNCRRNSAILVPLAPFNGSPTPHSGMEVHEGKCKAWRRRGGVNRFSRYTRPHPGRLPSSHRYFWSACALAPVSCFFKWVPVLPSWPTSVDSRQIRTPPPPLQFPSPFSLPRVGLPPRSLTPLYHTAGSDRPTLPVRAAHLSGLTCFPSARLGQVLAKKQVWRECK